ncbi:hypothetical protein FRB96_001197 [Tulasnella sp. 330]|nr:hypothetical protein FRB96_001197 [Tulasnella sp. 330]
MLRVGGRRLFVTISPKSRLVSNIAELTPHAATRPPNSNATVPKADNSSLPTSSPPQPEEPLPSTEPPINLTPDPSIPHKPTQLEELGISISRPTTNSSSSNDTAEGSSTSAVPSVTGRSQPGGPDRFDHVIPFDTHEFYKALEASFEPPVARTLMKATRGLLVGRIRNTYQDVVQVKDFDNGAYLFRAALSELRTELTMRTRKETATLRTALTALRKETDSLDAKMKEDIASLKHETDIEQAKWNNTRRGVLIISILVAFVIFSMEVAPKKPPPPPPPPPPAPAPVLVERPLPSVREMESDDTLVAVHPEERP